MAGIKRVAPDQKERDRIVSDLDTTFVVEAGAGSGKTTSLVDRLLALVVSGRSTIDKVAAVTFTRKAAAELRERFQVALEQKAASPITREEKERALDALRRIGEAAIGTIHSFCARMLRERPVEAGLDPEFREAEDAECEQLLERYWQEYLESAHISGLSDAEELKKLGILPAELEDLYMAMSLYRDVTPVAPVRPPPNLDAARKALLALIKRLTAAMPDEEPEAGWDTLQSWVNFTQYRIRTFGVDADPDLVVVLEKFERSLSVVQKRWNNSKAAKEFKDSLVPAFVAEYVQPSLIAWREYVYPYCIRFAKGAATYAAERRAAESVLDFGDLLLKARDLLRGDAEVCRFFAERYPRILVDEFQDTDPVQAEILFYLAGESKAADSDWRQRRIRPGSLFVVGDPKQSIYRFRRADIATYNLVKDLIVKNGGDVLSLTANFRSVDAIGQFVDQAFVDVFPKTADRYQASFTKLETRRKEVGNVCGVRRLAVPGREKKADVARATSVQVAAWIRWALDGSLQVEDGAGGLRPAKPEDFLVLTLNRDLLIGVAEALEERQIPYDLTGAKGFGEAPEVVGAMKLFACLANPDDQVAITAVLVGSLFGHSYEELYGFKKGGGQFRIIGARSSAEATNKSAIGESLARLETLWELTKGRSPASAAAAILDRTGWIPLTAASPLGATSAGRLYKLVELMRMAGGLYVGDFASAIQWLQEAIGREIEPLSVLLGEADVVRVMNLHKAKGLEAPVVVLAAPWEYGDHAPSLHVDRAGKGESTGYFIVSRKTGDYASKTIALPPDWEEKSAEEARYADAERSRLLYVAATRARQLLVVTDAPDVKKGTNPWRSLARYANKELSMDGVDVAARTRPRRTVDDTGAGKHAEAVRRALEVGAAASFRKEIVTGVTKAGGRPPAAGPEGKGPVWGEIIHRCLQAVAKGVILTTSLVESLMSERDWPVEDAGQAISLVDRVRKSDLWRRVEESTEKHTEVPFAMTVDGAEIGVAAGDCLLEGVIDLIFREDGKWVIVDYKTDRVTGDIDGHVKYYSPQVRLYAKAWERLSKEPVGTAYLFFAGPGVLSAVDLS